MKTALVLSAGGMFGAWQAGAWKAIAGSFEPDLVVGASIGAVNGWAIAGGCPPDELIDAWLNLEAAGTFRWQVPRRPHHGVLDSEPLIQVIRGIHAAYRPRTEFALVVTDLMKLRPRIVKHPEVTWEHLAASTALVGIFDQIRLEGRLYSDGGLLSALPIWAAAELGATRIVALDVLPQSPGLVAKTFVRTMRMIAPFRPVVPEGIEVIRLSPPKLLGSALEALKWKRENAEAWVRQGERDAATLKHLLLNCFERQ
ncbi:MAG: patatin-like phospholipase family protein [Acidobacteriota bacterium]|nr:patatin-like phospholipase family protein [Acidobacteriota bacterium]